MLTWSGEDLLPGGRLPIVIVSSRGGRGEEALWDLFYEAHS